MGARFQRDQEKWLRELQPGDLVQRVLCSDGCTLRLRVEAVTATRISCGEWEFDRATGAEVDDVLGWGPDGSGAWIRPPFR